MIESASVSSSKLMLCLACRVPGAAIFFEEVLADSVQKLEAVMCTVEGLDSLKSMGEKSAPPICNKVILAFSQGYMLLYLFAATSFE